TWIPGGLAVDHAGVGGGHDVVCAVVKLARGEAFEKLLHRLSVLVKLHDMPGYRARLLRGEGLVVGQKVAGACHVRFRLPIGASADGIVWALKKKSLAVAHELNAGV